MKNGNDISLAFQSLEVYFIYSLCFSVSDKISGTAEDPKKLLRKSGAAGVLKKLGTQELPNVTNLRPVLKESDEIRPIKFYVKKEQKKNVILNCTNLNKEPKVKLMGQEKLTVTLEPYITISNAGCGAITIKVALSSTAQEESFLVDDIHKILTLAPRFENINTSVDIPYFQIGNKMLTLNEVFSQQVSYIRQLFETALAKNKYCFSLEDERFWASDSKTIYSYQYPYAIVVAKLLDGHSFFLHDRKMDAHLENEIAQIIFRSVGDIDTSQINILKDLGTGLIKNLNPLSNILCVAHTTCSLMLTSKEDFYYQAIKNSVISIQELIRMRWHYLMMLNAKIDSFIQEIRFNYKSLKHRRLEIIEKIGDIKKELIQCLEDPLTYSEDANIAENITETMRSKLSFDRLQHNIVEKIKLLDSFYQNIQNFVGLKEIEEISLRRQEIEQRLKNKK